MLVVPHIRQTNPDGRNSCVPACVAMVLAFQGVEIGQRELCDLLETQPAGTPAWNVLLLDPRVPECLVRLDTLSFGAIEEAISVSVPPIAFVATRHLGYRQDDTIHAVVVTGLTDDEIYINDPMSSVAPQSIPTVLTLSIDREPESRVV